MTIYNPNREYSKYNYEKYIIILPSIKGNKLGMKSYRHWRLNFASRLANRGQVEEEKGVRRGCGGWSGCGKSKDRSIQNLRLRILKTLSTAFKSCQTSRNCHPTNKWVGSQLPTEIQMLYHRDNQIFRTNYNYD